MAVRGQGGDREFKRATKTGQKQGGLGGSLGRAKVAKAGGTKATLPKVKAVMPPGGGK